MSHLTSADKAFFKEQGYLVKQGVPPPSIQFRGKGADMPIADNKTEEGRRLNRRVEFTLVQRDWDAVY